MITISQSFLKDYHRPLCGVVLKSKYIDFDYPDVTSPAMNAGKYFEYLATGYIRSGDNAPEPERYVKSGNGYTAGEIKPEYRQAARHAEIFKAATASFGQPSYGEVLKWGNYRGIADAVYNGSSPDEPGLPQLPAIIDLKYSDLLYDRWNEYGWGIEKFRYASDQLAVADMLEVFKKVPLLWQPLLYCFLYFKQHGVYPAWYFYIASPKSDDVIFRQVIISRDLHDRFAALLGTLEAEIQLMLNTGGFTPLPSWNTCNACPLTGCQLRINLPEIETVTL